MKKKRFQCIGEYFPPYKLPLGGGIVLAGFTWYFVTFIFW